jgi:hypothetical protein
MTVEQHDVVDFVAKDAATRTFLLVISDHLPWDEINDHLFCLQEKLNCYFGFIESGELVKKYPDAAGHKIAVEIVLEHTPPDAAVWFFEKVRDASEAAGLSLTWRVLEL